MATSGNPVLESFFPFLKTGTYRETSPRTRRYNCAAWANGVDFKWWQALPGYYWPRQGVPTDGTTDAYVKLYEICGFVRCDDGTLEMGAEKVAIVVARPALRKGRRNLTRTLLPRTLRAEPRPRTALDPPCRLAVRSSPAPHSEIFLSVIFLSILLRRRQRHLNPQRFRITRQPHITFFLWTGSRRSPTFHPSAREPS
jgi:hypothetical protein